MKIALLLANAGGEPLEGCKEQIRKVLDELDLDVDVIDLTTLPYYKEDQVSPVAALISERLEASKGLIALVSSHVGLPHSTMQSFFEHCTRYEEVLTDKPLLVVSYSKDQGERQVAADVLNAWHILGGSDGGWCCLNHHTPTEALLQDVERKVESYYRILKQERLPMHSSEYYTYHISVTAPIGLSPEKKEEPFETVPAPTILKDIDTPVLPFTKEDVHTRLSPKEENIRDLTALLKGQLEKEDKKDYLRRHEQEPLPKAPPVVEHRSGVRVSSLPHYFIAQHDKDFQATVQYVITDIKEKGAIIIRGGDCVYRDKLTETPTVEIILTQEVLQQIAKKQLSYQKAFMIGKLKVKGNFGILAKLDQSFKAI